jgi:hypothetical protein
MKAFVDIQVRDVDGILQYHRRGVHADVDDAVSHVRELALEDGAYSDGAKLAHQEFHRAESIAAAADADKADQATRADVVDPPKADPDYKPAPDA